MDKKDTLITILILVILGFGIFHYRGKLEEKRLEQEEVELEEQKLREQNITLKAYLDVAKIQQEQQVILLPTQEDETLAKTITWKQLCGVEE